jgi:8-oxo-dGTP pyrophosphatase MutT (NUDIX family)
VTRIDFDTVRKKLSAHSPARIVDPSSAEAGVALILVPVEGDLEALFIRRAELAGDPWSGHMALPGGRRHAGDRDLLGTAIRETHEETGIVLAPAEFLGDLDDFTPRTPHLPRIVVRPHVFGLTGKPAVVPSDEVASFHWISLNGLRSSYGEIDLDVAGVKMRRQAFVMGKMVVWGLTERILKPFLDLLDNIG